MKSKILLLLAVAHGTFFTTSDLARAQGTAFTYQGRLTDSGQPANGIYDLTFIAYDSLVSGSQQGPIVTNSATAVSNGLFTVTLDFGANVFTGPARWLGIGARTNGVGLFQTLAPRQQLTPAPYAITAENLNGTVSGSSLSGTYGSAVTLNNTANQFSGNGANVTNVNAAKLGGVPLSGLWQTGGNLGTSPGANILGSLDNQPLELWVDGFRAFKITPGTNNTANLIGGSGNNAIDPGVTGAVIAGGGGGPVNGQFYFNNIHANFSSIGGGTGNTASNVCSTVAGGLRNTAGGPGSFVGGGGYDGSSILGNTASGAAATVSGGASNTAGSDSATVGGGYGNTAGAPFAQYPTVSGGHSNTASSTGATVGGGENNTASGVLSTMAGGAENIASGAGSFVGGGGFDGFQSFGNTASGGGATVGGGLANVASGLDSTIPGGYNCTAIGSASFAAGFGAGANNDGCFVWSDGNTITGLFHSSAPNQFVIHASGGVGIGTGVPETPLHVADFHGITIGTSATANGFTALRIDLSADVNGYAELQAIGQAGSSYGNLILQANGGNVGIGTTTPAQKLAVNGNILASGTITGSSDRNVKEHFSPVSARDVLEKVSALPISEWNYKADNETLRHIGPMAQDFYAAFNVGMDDKHISMVDADGVALAAIQGLNQKLNDKDAEIHNLEKRLDELQAMVKQLAARK